MSSKILVALQWFSIWVLASSFFRRIHCLCLIWMMLVKESTIFEAVMGYLLGYSSTARFKKFCNLFLQFFGKFAESLRVSRNHKELKMRNWRIRAGWIKTGHSQPQGDRQRSEERL